MRTTHSESNSRSNLLVSLRGKKGIIHQNDEKQLKIECGDYWLPRREQKLGPVII